MELNELTKKVEQVTSSYANEFNFNRDNDWFMFKLQEEIGELTQKYLMMTSRGRQKGLSKDQIRNDFELEVADVLCQVLLLANHNNVNVMDKINSKWLRRLNQE